MVLVDMRSPISKGVGRCVKTDAGRALLAHAEAAFGYLAAAQDELAAIAGLRAGTLRLGTFASAGATVIVPALSAFHAHHPDVKLALIEAEPRESISLVRAGELDLAVIYDSPRVSQLARRAPRGHPPAR